MRFLRTATILIAAALAACTPADQEYCSGFGVLPGDREYPPCVTYFHQQQASFGADYNVCALEADRTYPPTLYDTWRTGYVHRFDPRYGYAHVDTVDIPPDMAHNAQVDALRGQIIQPCMHQKGWNSAETWQAGRHAVKPMRRVPSPAPTGNALPWLR